MNYSKQRETILNVLRSTKSHPTANDIYVEMKKSDPKISLGTVYRNLSVLAENGMILRLDTEHDSVHYDGCVDQHYHFVCNDCKKVMDLDITPIESEKQIEEKYGCSVSGHTLIFYGTCNNCKQKN